MDAAKIEKKDLLPKAQKNIKEPQSAHATPVVENYIKTRNKKAEKQIKHQEHGETDAE